MAGPGGKSAGRLSIRVVPNSSKFRDDLKVMLERAENTMRLSIQVQADKRSADSTLRKLKKDWDGKNVDLNAGVKTAGATAHLKEFTRPRILPIVLKVSRASVAKVGAYLASLSGLSALQDIGKRLDSFFTDIGKDLPKIALAATSIGGLGATALNAVHGLGGVVVGLSQLVPLAALLPGMLLGTAVGVTTLIVAFKSAPRSILSALSAYKSLQGIIAGNFWAEAANPIRGFLKGILPQLKTGFAGTSAAIGTALGGIASTLNSAFSGGVLASIFANLQAGVVAALPGLNSFSTAFVSLLSVGAAFLPQFGAFISKIGSDFSAWVTGAEASGQLTLMITTALNVLKALGSSLVSIGSILSGVFTAGGSDAIAGMAFGLQQIAAAVNSPAFQTTLATIFAGAAQGATGLGAALAPIGTMLSALAPLLSAVLARSGVVFGQLLGSVAKAIASPVFQKGLSDFFSGILSGIIAIQPALPALATAFSAIGTVVGQLGATLGTSLAGILIQLAPIVTDLLNRLTPLIPILGTALVDAVTQLAPILSSLITELPLEDLVNAIVLLLPELVTLVEEIKPLLDAFIGFVKFGLTPTSDAFNTLADWFDQLGPLGQLAADFARTLGQVFSGGIGGIIKGAFNGILHAIGGGLNGLIDLVNLAISGLQALAGAIGTISGGAVKISIAKIPHISVPTVLATGGDVLATRGGVSAILGEGGRDERVVDRGLGNKALAASIALAQRALRTDAGAGGDATIYVTPPAGEDSRVVARAWMSEWRRK